MTGEMKILAKTQDLIGFRHFMEGRISKQLWEIQSRHLALSPSHMNGTKWTKHFITRIIKITQSQWMYRNVSFHDKQYGYAKRKRVEELNHTIRHLCDTNPRNLPEESRFLLERDESDSVLKKEYWVESMEAAIKAGSRKAKMGRRARRTRREVRKRLNRNARLGVYAVEREIREDMEVSGQIPVTLLRIWRQGGGKRGATAMRIMGSNKRFKPGD